MSVIGPISPEDWYLLRELRDIIPFMRERNAQRESEGRFTLGIKAHQECYFNTIRSYISAGKSIDFKPIKIQKPGYCSASHTSSPAVNENAVAGYLLLVTGNR